MQLVVLLLTAFAVVHCQECWLNAYQLDAKFDLEAMADLGCKGFDIRVSYNASLPTYEMIGCEEDAKALKELGYTIVHSEPGKPFSERAPPSGYDTPQQLYSKFTALTQKAPAIAMLFDLNDEYKTPLTVEGRSIQALKISDNVASDEDEPNILLVGNHHARELITPQLALDSAERIIDGYLNGDPTLTNLVNTYQVYIMWTNNPDGLNYVWTVNDFWRKNRRPNGGSSYGVDLNRNYPFGWDFSCGGSTNPNSETYRGPSPESEPETKTMVAFQHDRKFVSLIDWHSYGRDTRPNYGGNARLPAPMDKLFQDIATTMGDKMGYRLYRSTAMGGDIHTAYHDSGTLATLLETGNSFQPSGSAMREELVRCWPGTLYYMTLPIPVQGHARSASSGAPLQAYFDIAGLDFFYNEVRPSNPRTGYYFLWLPTGTWQITARADGYQPKTISVTVTTAGTTQDFLL